MRNGTECGVWHYAVSSSGGGLLAAVAVQLLTRLLPVSSFFGTNTMNGSCAVGWVGVAYVPMDVFEPSRMLLEVASWRVASDIVRRHPQVRVIETHPGGGQYDCVQLLLQPDKGTASPSIVLNRAGSAHIQFGDYDSKDMSWTGFWTDYLAADDPRDVVRRLSDMAKLPQVSKLSRSTPAVLV